MYVKKTVETKFRDGISIMEELNELVERSGVQEGYCVVSLSEPETALAITSFWDKRGLDDLFDEIERNIPSRVNYKNQTSPYNASGNVKGALIGRSEMLLIHSGKLVLGSSQGMVILEFDGPGKRNYSVCIKEALVSFTKHHVSTRYMGMHDITVEIKNAVKESGITCGICHISQLHSTAGLLLCAEAEAARDDLMSDIEYMVPTRADFKHRETASDAGGHVKTALTGSQISLVVDRGALVLSEEQVIVFAEYDGPRPRNYVVGVIQN